METCKEFLLKIAYAIQSRTITDDPTIIQTFSYSGVQWNDQGDINSCLNSSTMNFVEVAFVLSQQRVFRGLCLPNQCSASWLNENKEIIMEFAKQFQIPSLLNKNSITFTQYPPTDLFKTSSMDFILITILLSIFFLLIVISFFLSKQLNQPKKTKNKQGVILVEQLIISKSNIEQPLIRNEYNKNDTGTTQQEIQQKRDLNIIFKIINCWNLRENANKVKTLNANNKELLGFNCIRVISFLQVILGHEFFIRLQYMSNPRDMTIIQAQPFTLFIFSCLYSVDVFFFLGGFFVSYVSADPRYLNLFSLKKQFRMISTFFAAIINRLFRILPSYLVALLIFWKYSDFIGDSPTWYEFINFSKQCDDGWWKRVLLIDNLFEDGQKCFGWGWYLSNDMQMFIFSLILIIIYANNKIYGKISIVFTFLVFQFVSIYTSYANNYLIISSLETMPNQEYYFKPWNRSPPYFIGLIAGIIYKEYVQEKSSDQKTNIISKLQFTIQVKPIFKWVLYFVGIGIILFLIFGPRQLQTNGKNYWSEGFQNFWFGTSRTFYVLGILLIILPGMCGSQDLLMKVMSSRFFQFLAKLTFQGYLIHYIVLTYSLWNFKDSLYVNNENIIQLYFAETVLTLSLAYVFVILVELPFTNLANLIFHNKSKKISSKMQEPTIKQQQGEQIKITQNIN